MLFTPPTCSRLGLLRLTKRRNLLICLAPFLALPSSIRALAFSVSKEQILKFSETATDPTMAAYDWCCTASVCPTTNEVEIQKIAGYNDDGDAGAHNKHSPNGSTFDITSNAQWMEYIEQCEGRENVEGGAGAYDVMRCDLAYKTHSSLPPVWRVWGEDFHLNRLTTSYRSLLEHMDNASTSDAEIDVALEKSRAVIRDLLDAAQSSDIMQSQAPSVDNEEHDVMIQLTKLTILWTPTTSDGSNHDITVRGHACSSCKPVQIHKRPTPIVATVALPLDDGPESNAKTEALLPSRFRSPQNKVASWCRLRKPLENPDTYKPPGVGEVLMVRPGTRQLLEGLTSNVFVIYKNGTVRTADKGVLCGYVRHLVENCAERAGLKMDYTPIEMDDASKGLWESAFITSSSRLIYPISRILIPHVDSDGSEGKVTFQEFWSDPSLIDEQSSSSTTATPRWLNLLNELLLEGGYEAMAEE